MAFYLTTHQQQRPQNEWLYTLALFSRRVLATLPYKTRSMLVPETTVTCSEMCNVTQLLQILVCIIHNYYLYRTSGVWIHVLCIYTCTYVITVPETVQNVVELFIVLCRVDLQYSSVPASPTIPTTAEWMTSQSEYLLLLIIQLTKYSKVCSYIEQTNWWKWQPAWGNGYHYS